MISRVVNVSDGDLSDLKMVAKYGCNSFSIAALMKGSRFFVLKIG
jgi:hypothetical protein